MNIKDLFTIQFRKPNLTSEESDKANLKKDFENRLAFAFSRLESVEILNANGKEKDAKILAIALFEDIKSLAFYYKTKKESTTSPVPLASVTEGGSPDLKEVFAKAPELEVLLADAKEWDEEASEKAETLLNDILNLWESHFRKAVKVDLYTPLDDFKRRAKWQIAFLGLVIASVVGGFLYRAVKYPPLQPSDFKVFFLADKNFPPNETDSKATPIDLKKVGEYVDYEFPVTGFPQLGGLRLDPTGNPKVKFSIEKFSVLGENDKLLTEKTLVYSDGLIPLDQDSYGPINDVKLSGKAIAGKVIEMESIGSDPYVTLYFPPVKGAKKVVVRARMIEAHKKFSK